MAKPCYFNFEEVSVQLYKDKTLLVRSHFNSLCTDPPPPPLLSPVFSMGGGGGSVHRVTFSISRRQLHLGYPRFEQATRAGALALVLAHNGLGEG